MASAELYLEHLAKLASSHRLEVIMGATIGDSRAWRRLRRVHIPHVRGEISYLVALHEFGHILACRSTEQRDLQREGAAWRWAIDNALCPPSRSARHSINIRLRSYLDWAQQNQHLPEAALPPKGAEFWLLLEQTAA